MEFEPLGKSGDFRAWCDTLYRRVRKKALLFMISDFIGEVDLRLLAKKHDLFCIIVRDRFEEDPKSLGYIRLIDTEGRGSIEGDMNSSMMLEYKKALKANDHKLYRHFRENGIRYAKIYTDEDAFIKLSKRLR